MLRKILTALSRFFKSVILAFALLPYLWFSVTTRSRDAFLLDKIIATINQEQILHSELEEICQQFVLECKVVDASVKMDVL